MDPIFAEEQQHLTQTYAKLCELGASIEASLASHRAEIADFSSNVADDLMPSFDSADVTMETLAEYALVNNVIQDFNQAIASDMLKLSRVGQLKRKPYFARIQLAFPGKDEVRDVYLGSTALADENFQQLIIDWRAPVAEAYYGGQMGPVTYHANGKLVKADLLLRRQFDLKGDVLKAYFDTDLAIEDPMLLHALGARRTDQLQAITSTIQAEQNTAIRHEDVPVLLVRGVAGSGKTSVMLQRIAYLLFHMRETLNADQVYLISPNPVFTRYIRNVLPELGEKNPRSYVWANLMERLGAGNRNPGYDVDPAELARVDAAMAALELTEDDVSAIALEQRTILSPAQIMRVVAKYLRRMPMSSRLMGIVEEDLLEKFDNKLRSLAKTASVHDEILCLSDEEQDEIWGHGIDAMEDEELAAYAIEYLEWKCRHLREQIERGDWLRVDRIGMRMLGKQGLSGTEWVYVKLVLTGKADTAAKFVMVDEVQDYSAGQLMVLAKYFSRAHFLLLGDPNQAIRPGTATFDQIRSIMRKARGKVGECALMTSYRATPQIAALCASLVPAIDGLQIQSVQRPGAEPRMAAFADDAAYLDELERTIRSMEEGARASAPAGDDDGACGITAVVVNSARRARWLAKQLASRMGADAPLPIAEGMELPAQGAIMIELELAKGLEFDRVIVADASAGEFGDDELSRRRLYTAVSRATQEVVLLAEGELSPLLA